MKAWIAKGIGARAPASVQPSRWWLFCLSLMAILWLGIVQPRAASAMITVRSRGDGQFIIHGVPSESVMANAPKPDARSGRMRLDPAVLAVTCDRIKQVLLRELDCPDDWKSVIDITLQFTPNTNQSALIQGVRLEHGWQGRMLMPDEMEATAMVRAVVQILVMEMANRQTGDGLAEVPLWITEGLTQLILVSAGPTLIPNPQSPFIQVAVKSDPITLARSRVLKRPPLTFTDLSMPTPEMLRGRDWESFQDFSFLLMCELLRLPGGKGGLVAMLHVLPHCMNWQTGFFQGFQAQFQQLIDVEKWWAIILVKTTAHPAINSSTPETSLLRLNEILHLPAEIRPRPDSPGSATNITMQDFLRGWRYEVQKPFLEGKLQQLQTLKSTAAPQVALLVEQYRAILENYINNRDNGAFAPGVDQRRKPALPKFFVSDTASQLDRLDRQRQIMQQKLAASPPRPK